MIARELTEFFAGFSPDGGRAIQRSATDGLLAPGFLSNANAAYRRPTSRRSASATSPTPRTRRSPATCFAAGEAEGLPPGRRRPARARLPVARVHAPLLRRVPRAARDDRARRADRRALDGADGARRASRGDRAFLSAQGAGPRRARGAGRRARPRTTAGGGCSPRSARAPTGCPRAARRVLSLEGRADGRPRPDPLEPAPHDRLSARRAHGAARELFAEILDYEAHGAAPLLAPVPGISRADAAAHRDRDPAVSHGQRWPRHDLPRSSARSSGSGTRARSGSTTRSGHMRGRVAGRHPRPDPHGVRAAERTGLHGASTTGTARTSCSPPAGRPSSRCCSSTHCRARAYFVQDHEPEFYAAAAERAGRPRPTRRVCTRSARARGSRTSCASATAAPPRSSSSGRTRPSTTRATCRAGATRSSSTAARSRRAAPCRSGCSRSPSCTAVGRTRASSSTATRCPLETSFPYEHAGVASQEQLAWPLLGGDRRGCASR